MPYVEDFESGQTHHLGQYAVSEDEIVEFARKWDPQRFHLEANHDAETPFDGIIASGWHTAAIFMKLYVAAVLNDGRGLGSPGLDELRWPEPVRAGDTVTATSTVERIMPSISHQNGAIITQHCQLLNQHDQTVMSMRLHVMFQRRPAAEAGNVC